MSLSTGYWRTGYRLLAIAYCLLPIVYCLLPIASCLFPIAYCIAYCLLPIAYCLQPIHIYTWTHPHEPPPRTTQATSLPSLCPHPHTPTCPHTHSPTSHPRAHARPHPIPAQPQVPCGAYMVHPPIQIHKHTILSRQLYGIPMYTYTYMYREMYKNSHKHVHE